MKMIEKMTDEEIRAVINNAPKGAEYWTHGCDTGYRKLVLDVVFCWHADGECWVRAINNDAAMKWIDKGYWIPNVAEELVKRYLEKALTEQSDQLTNSAQTKEVEWVNGEPLVFNGEPCTFIGMCNSSPVVKYSDNADPSLAGCIDEILSVELLSRPETPEQKLERERIKAAKHLYSKHCAAVRHPVKDLDNNSELLNAWLVIVDETNYKVKGE